MRRFWFAMSLVAVFVFAAASSYVFFVWSAGRGDVAEPGLAVSESVWPGVEVEKIAADTRLVVRENYACGYVAESAGRADELAGDWAWRTFDELAAAGWQVAKTGEGCVELVRECAGQCPIEQEKRLIRATERGVAVYAGESGHLGAMLLEMPLNFAEVPTEVKEALAGDGYQLASREELDEVLESLDELVERE